MYIEKLDTFRNGYNQTTGGEGSYTEAQIEYSSSLKYDLIYTDLSYAELMEKYNLSKETISKINNGKSFYDDSLTYPLRKAYAKEYKYRICGKAITKGSTYCIDCGHDVQKKVDRPGPEQLAKEIVESSFVAVGRKYGVSDNAIRKWCKAYGIPHKIEELKEWLLQ